MTCTASIIIRALNEEKWISSCLSGVFRQDFTDFEVILVDNQSSDLTVEKAKSFPIEKVITIAEFLPGKALNLGINHSRGEYIICLSAHCIPVNSKWLGTLLKTIQTHDHVAGVYGRQEPMAFTDDVDKRDLINIFGLDRKIQVKDPFFHNANSIIKRDVWETTPFSETTTNIEDRLWAKEVLAKGFQIIYEPEASVYHYHGINQGRNIQRARNVVRILEKIHPSFRGEYIHDDMKITAIIPVRGQVKRIKGMSLLELTIESLRHSKYIKDIIVAADNEEHMNIARSLNARVIRRPNDLSYEYIEVIKVYQYVLEALKDEGKLPDLIVLAQEVYPFRPKKFFDRMIKRLVNSDRDCVIAAKPIYKSIWRGDEDNLIRVDNGFIPSKYKEPLFMALYGLGCIMEPNIILRGEKIGQNVGLITIDDPYSYLSANNGESMKIIEQLLPRWREYLESEERI
ncbi:MAG: glycosyltransferase family 2 protein [Deltaproteobacteria bacterium]|nr:glycosyltransferase family 2 protein [Deltaproteobacteria bacterium]